MAKIIVTLNGVEIAVLNLEDGMEYIAGRSPDAAIVLENQKGISRQHLKFYQQDGIWIVELLARFGSIVMDGKSHEAIELNADCVFSAPPFNFSFTLTSEVVEEEPPPAESPERPTSLLPATRTPTEIFETKGNIEATIATVSSLVAFLKISKSKQREEIVKLEGHLWVAGRDPSCEIPIDDDRASRRHFELIQTREGFFVTDLGSSNGTYLNEELLTPNEPWQLTSGDVLRVSKVSAQFEVRDANFNKQLATINAAQDFSAHGHGNYPVSQSDAAFYGSTNHLGPAVVKLADPHQSELFNLKNFDFKKHKVKLIVGALLPLILYGLLRDDAKTPTEAQTQVSQSSESVSYDNLLPEQKRAVKDSFNLAKTMYVQGKYELCLAELKKLHEIVPMYSNSKEVEGYCGHGVELVLRERDIERKEQEKAENNRFVAKIVDGCRKKMNPRTTPDDLRICMADAIERDPENPTVRELLAVAEGHQDDRRRQKELLENQRERTIAGERIFNKAKQLYRAGQLSKSIHEYERFLNGSYPDLASQKTAAERDIASVRKELSDKLASLIKTCKEDVAKAQFRTAVLNCDKALVEDPNNSEATLLKDRATSELRHELRSLYEDSVLEESMGNIDTAKERWKQIMEKAIPGDEYHSKARRNLQKYGIGT